MRRHGDSPLIAVMVVAAMLASTLVQVTIAKQTSSSTILPDSNIFLTYKDPNSEFNVKYPSNWIKSNSHASDAVFDSSRVKVDEPIKAVRIEISVKNVDQYLDEKQMVLKDKTAYDYINDILEAYDPYLYR